MLFYTLLLDTQEEKTKLEQLYLKYQKVMFNVAYDILNDQMAAEDAVHMSVLKIIKCLDALDLNMQEETARKVIIIVKNTAIDIYRKRKKEQILTSLDALEDWQIPSKLYDVFWELPEENRIIEAIKCMPPLYREVFIMKYHYRYDNKKIAEMFQLSEASVRKRISRGKAKLEALLEEKGVL